MADQPQTLELTILPVRDVVLFPAVVLPVAIDRPRSTAAAQEAVRSHGKIGFLLQRSDRTEDPGPDDLYEVGTVASIARFVTAPDGVHHLICQGEQRFVVEEFIEREPLLRARVRLHTDPEAVGGEVEARALYLKDRAIEALKLVPQAPVELIGTIQAIKAPGQLADLVISVTDVSAAEKQGVLETLELAPRLDRVIGALAKRIEVLKLSHDIGEKTREALNERQKEAVLREQLRQIRRELGEEGEGPSVEVKELKEAIERAGMPEEAREQALRELNRLERMPEGSGEHSMVRTYLDWLIALPWSKLDPENLDIEAARRVLDADHFGLEKVKRRILEFLAVRKLNPEGRSPILCFVGPPGVGKTSLGQSIARALGLKFGRVSLGGVHDEAEIRGHRRTYLGSLPGNILQALRRAGTRNPVLMLDEVDKLSSSYQGDPYSALLEVLDPEQNSTFR
ncbi:MAG: LON peptidase substrate-binding domain-containing protein, partial [Steroidobacteraceae bacterium]